MMEPRRVFITGASSGIGAGLARHYAQPGATLGLVARRLEMLQNLARELQESGAVAYPYAGDVSDTDGLRGIIEQYLSRSGGVDVVIASAGVGLKYAEHERTPDQVSRLMSTNVSGLVNTLLPFVPTMVSQRCGVLVGISSVAGFRAMPWHSAYCASKAAVKTYIDGLRMELRGTGVHAMTVCPGFIDTALLEKTPRTPFLLDVPTAVRKITRAIARRRKTYVFPWPWRLLNPIWTRVPEALLSKFIPPPDDADRHQHPTTGY